MQNSIPKYFRSGLIVSTAVLILASEAYAQLGALKNAIGGGGASNAMSVKDVEANLTGLKAQFTFALKQMASAQAITLEALGRKDEADKAAAEAKTLSEGNCDSACMKRAVKVTEAAVSQSNEAMAKSTAISAEAKAKLATAVPPYLEGTVAGVKLPGAYANWVSSAQATVSSVQSNPLQAVSAARLIKEVPEIAEVSTSLPSLITAWTQTSSNFSSFAKKNGIDTKTLDEEAKKKF